MPELSAAGWTVFRRQAAGEALARALRLCGYDARCRPRRDGDAALLVTGEAVRRLAVGPVELLRRGVPLAQAEPDWPRGVQTDAALFFLTARPLSAPAELDLDLAARRDLGNPYYAVVSAWRRLETLLPRWPEGPAVPPAGEGRALALAVARFPSAVRRAAESLDPFPLNRYAAALAEAVRRSLCAPSPAQAGPGLARGAQAVLGSALGLLGIGSGAGQPL